MAAATSIRQKRTIPKIGNAMPAQFGDFIPKAIALKRIRSGEFNF
jgi:hypothetical protein